MIGHLLGAAVVLLLPVAAAAHGEHGAARPRGSAEIEVTGTLARRGVSGVR